MRRLALVGAARSGDILDAPQAEQTRRIFLLTATLRACGWCTASVKMCTITFCFHLFPCSYTCLSRHLLSCCYEALPKMPTLRLRRVCVMQAQVQATDALMVEQKFSEGPIESWLTSFVAWAADTSAYRCALLFRRFLAVRRVVSCAPPMSTVVGLPQ